MMQRLPCDHGCLKVALLPSSSLRAPFVERQLRHLGQPGDQTPLADDEFTLGRGRYLERLDRQGLRRAGRELHHADLNVDACPLMSRMHKPDPRLGPD